MTTKTLAAAKEDTGYAGIVTAFIFGAALLFVGGISQASILHDAAHDQRHAMAFPCH